MAMGSTGTVNMTPEMLQNALTAIEDYETTARNLRESLSTTVGGLIPSNFSGAAADGFLVFHAKNIEEPLFEEALPDLLKALEDIIQGTLDAIPGADGLDDQLGEGNSQ
ncbi:MAG: hypothetical protein FWD27_08680 [Coriobacteriia bacterium]|nr:hypothetical protein [Coriobacteriia bacterium]